MYSQSYMHVDMHDSNVISSSLSCLMFTFSLMFYTSSDTVYKARLDGSGRKSLTTTPFTPTLAVNFDTKRICFAEQCISKIFSYLSQ